MNNKDQNRELLSRRDFFRKAAINTLPFIAAIAVPPIFTACTSEPTPTPTGCDGCSSTCEGSCDKSCSGSCEESCAGSSSNSGSSCSDCSNSCKENCSTSCKESCLGTCKESCSYSSENSSQGNTGSSDKHTAVDLGLSVLWATNNLGSTNAAEYAPRYNWGRKENEEYNDWKKWLDEGKNNITSTDRDIVQTTWEEGWRLPSYSEARELVDLCKCTAETRNDVRGLKVVGPNGNSIFLSIEKGYSATLGLYMTGTRESKNMTLILVADADEVKLDYGSTSITGSLFVRPVKDGGSGCKDCSSGCMSGCYVSCINSAKSPNQSGGNSSGGNTSGGNNTSGCATCENTCNSGCGEQCYYSCGGTCSNNCQGGCRFSCIGWSMSVKNCSSSCYGSCNNNCDNTCKSFCYTSCQNVGKQS